MVAGAQRPDQDPGAPAAVARQTILVVEDEPALLRALRINLRARGYEAVTVQAGRPALEKATQRKPDAVILDLGLPDLDGIDLIRELRLLTSAPVIVLSGRTGPGDKIGALDAGADDYVTKPFSMEELLARLRAALRRDGPPPAARPVAIGRSTIDLDAHLATRGRRAGPAHADRVAAAGDPASATRASWSRDGGCSPRCGGPPTPAAATTCASTWPGCGASSRTTRPGPVTCSPSPAWATASSPDHEGPDHEALTTNARTTHCPRSRMPQTQCPQSHTPPRNHTRPQTQCAR